MAHALDFAAGAGRARVASYEGAEGFPAIRARFSSSTPSSTRCFANGARRGTRSPSCARGQGVNLRCGAANAWA